MKQSLIPLLVAVGASLSSCASSTPVQRYSESVSRFDPPPVLMSHNYPERDIYRIYHRGGSGFVPINSVRYAAEDRAEQFARRQGRKMVVLGDRIARPPYILGNFPRVEIVFALTGDRDRQDEPKPDYKPTKFIP